MVREICFFLEKSLLSSGANLLCKSCLTMVGVKYCMQIIAIVILVDYMAISLRCDQLFFANSLPENSIVSCLFARLWLFPVQISVRTIAQGPTSIQIPNIVPFVHNFHIAWQLFAVFSCLRRFEHLHHNLQQQALSLPPNKRRILLKVTSYVAG